MGMGFDDSFFGGKSGRFSQYVDIFDLDAVHQSKVKS